VLQHEMPLPLPSEGRVKHYAAVASICAAFVVGAFVGAALALMLMGGR
jgi:hypothetical protein